MSIRRRLLSITIGLSFVIIVLLTGLQISDLTTTWIDDSLEIARSAAQQAKVSLLGRLENKGAASIADTRRLLGQLDRRIEGLLRKALFHAGLSRELAESESTELQWRSVGFRPGVDLARGYVRPENLKRYTAYHVRVSFPSTISGPVAIGAGRYRGMGVFAAE